jgi:hypothetical protein
MALDRISEEIAHFIGLFHLETEAAKLRFEYQAFRLARDAPELDPIQGNPFSGNSVLPENALKVGLKNPQASVAQPTWESVTIAPLTLPNLQTYLENYQVAAEQTILPLPWFGSIITLGPAFEIFPNSIILAVTQSAFLSDNDLLLFDGSANFVDPDLLMTALLEAGEVARSLSLVDPWVWQAEDGSIYESALAMKAALAEADLPDHEGVDAVLLRGDAAEGIFTNGQATDDLPVIKDLLPEFLQPEETGADQNLIDRELPSDGITQHDTGPFGVDPGHHVVTGGNQVVNEAALKSVWVDAPVIAVSQNVIRLDVISQINLRQEASYLPDYAVYTPSSSLNIAQLEQSSASKQDDAQPDAQIGRGDGLPSFWNVTRLESDLMLMNWVQQHIFVSDYDRVEVKFSGAATYMGTGENIVFNETSLLSLGFHYDLIMVGGNMITLNQISQINVMLDQDIITGAVPAATSLHAGDNLQLNMGTITTTGIDTMVPQKDHFAKALDELKAGATTLSADVAKDSMFAGKDTLSVLYIDGDLIQTNVIEQINYLGDSDQIHFIKDMFSTAAGAEVTVTSGSNAQINSAKIISEGLDSLVMAGGEVYSDALIYQVGLIDDAAAPTGVQLEPLATEAVAFLTDEADQPSFDQTFGAASDSADAPLSADIMQTMLA